MKVLFEEETNDIIDKAWNISEDKYDAMKRAVCLASQAGYSKGYVKCKKEK